MAITVPVTVGSLVVPITSDVYEWHVRGELRAPLTGPYFAGIVVPPGTDISRFRFGYFPTGSPGATGRLLLIPKPTTAVLTLAWVMPLLAMKRSRQPTAPH